MTLSIVSCPRCWYPRCRIISPVVDFKNYCPKCDIVFNDEKKELTTLTGKLHR